MNKKTEIINSIITDYQKKFNDDGMTPTTLDQYAEFSRILIEAAYDAGFNEGWIKCSEALTPND